MQTHAKKLAWSGAGISLLMVGVVVLSAPWRRDTVMAEAESASPDQSLKFLESTAEVFESVARVVSPAVVYLEARSYDSKGKMDAEESGSGILFRPAGMNRSLVLTNCHVIGDALPEDVDIHLCDGRMYHPAKIWRDSATDIALLDPQLEHLPAAKFGDSDEARIGQWVLVIGSPFGLSQSVTHGIVSATRRRRLGLPSDVRIQEFLQTDAAINPGNSGGPLVNLNGEVIGINTAIASRTGANSGVGFSIPVNLAQWVVAELLEHGKVRRGFLGVEFPNTFDYEDAVELGLDARRGALVARVHDDTPASRAGIQVRDVIIEFSGSPVEDEYHLINLVSRTPAGSSVDVVVWRDQQRLPLRVTMSSWDQFQLPTGPTSKD